MSSSCLISVAYSFYYQLLLWIWAGIPKTQSFYVLPFLTLCVSVSFGTNVPWITGFDFKSHNSGNSGERKEEEERSESTSSSPNKCAGKSMKGWLGNIMFQDLNGENSKEIGRITSKKIVGRKRIFFCLIVKHIFLE